MAAIEYDVADRLFVRSAEIAAEPGMNPGVVRVYIDVLKGPADAYRKAHSDVAFAETAHGTKSLAAAEVIEGFDKHYKVARSVVLAFVPAASLPDTLKAQKTDTDRLSAIESLLSMINANAGETWADELLAGDFGVLGPKAATVMSAAVTSGTALWKAREVRAQAFEPAYEKFIAFKRVVRDALGSRSRHYRRIHVPRGGQLSTENGEGSAPSPMPAAPVAPLAPTLEVSCDPTS